MDPHVRAAAAFLCLTLACTPAIGFGGPAKGPARSVALRISLGGQSTEVFAHPRIWLDPARLAKLKAKARSSNPMWVVLDRANRDQLQSGAYKKTADPLVLLNLAIGYLASGRKVLLSAAREALANFPSTYDISCDGTRYCGNPNLDYGSEDLVYLSAAYDWLANDLSEVEKQPLRNWVFKQLLPFLRKHPYAGDPKHNLGHTKWIGELMWALATAGDDPRSQAVLNRQFALWTEQIAPLLDKTYPGGHTFGGSGYGYNRSFKFALFGMEALTTATGMDGYAGHPWAIDGIPYRIHSVLPSRDSFYADWESAEAKFNQGRMNENEALLVQRFEGTRESEYGQFFLQNVFRLRALFGQGGNAIHRIYAGRWFLWYDPAAPARSYFDGPTAYAASGLGLGFTRSTWKDANSAWASFSSASFIGDHQLHNEGSFKIWKNGEYLAIENGRCYAANSGDETPTDANILFLGDGIVGKSTTGGLPRRGDPGIAEIKRFSRGDTFAVFVADLTKAYDRGRFPLRSFDRIFVHFHAAAQSPDDYFVVADRIEPVDALRKKQFIHVPSAPSVEGRDASAATGRGRINIRSVLPMTATISAEVVPDKTGGCLPQEDQDRPSRVVVEIPAGRSALILTVLQAGSPSSVLPETEPIVSDTAAGVLIKDPAFLRALVIGRTSEPLRGTVSFSCRTAGTTEFVVADLPENQHYRIDATKRSGELSVHLVPSEAGPATADARGVLHFTM